MGRPGQIILKTDHKQLLCVQVPLKMDDRCPQRGSTRDMTPAFAGGSMSRSPGYHTNAEIPPQRDCTNPTLPDGSQEPCVPKWWDFNSGMTLHTYWMVGSLPFSSCIPCWGEDHVQRDSAKFRSGPEACTAQGVNLTCFKWQEHEFHAATPWDLSQMILLHFFSPANKIFLQSTMSQHV